MDCFNCSTPLPEKAFFCPNCAIQVKCKSCSESLIKDAKVCIFCGEEIGNKSLVTNMNTIEFSESKNTRNFKAIFTDTVGQSISDSFGIILANKISTKKTDAYHANTLLNNTLQNEATQQDEPFEDAIVITPEITQLKKIFKIDGDKTTLTETRLKAASKRDYGIRLTLLFLYYKSLLGIENVPRKDLTAIVENASVEDGNFRHWVGKNPLIGIDGDTVEIKAPGIDQAKKYLQEIANPDIKDKWQIGTQSRVGRKAKEKKTQPKK